MEKNKQLTIALPVLLGIVILVWLPHLNSAASKSRGKGNSKEAKDSAISHKEVVSLMKDYSSAKVSAKNVEPWGERNPFDPGLLDTKMVKDKQDKTKGQTKNLIKNKAINKSVMEYRLSGIFWNEQKPSAIINDLVMDVGSMIGSYKIKEISANKVILSDGIKDVVLMLEQK